MGNTRLGKRVRLGLRFWIWIWICPIIGKPPTGSITPMRRWCYWQCSNFRRDLNVSTVMLLTVSSGRLFHAGIVFTKNDCLNIVVFAPMFLNLYGWFTRVRGSAGVRMPSVMIAAKWLTILYSSTSLKSRLRSASGSQPRSFNIWVILLVCLWSFFTFLAALRWTISSAFLSLHRYGSQTVALVRVSLQGLVLGLAYYNRRMLYSGWSYIIITEGPELGSS